VDAHRRSLASDVLGYLRANRKWWLLPIVAVLLLVGALLAAGNAAPFLYPLF
jgi:hypothetical protein